MRADSLVWLTDGVYFSARRLAIVIDAPEYAGSCARAMGRSVSSRAAVRSARRVVRAAGLGDCLIIARLNGLSAQQRAQAHARTM